MTYKKSQIGWILLVIFVAVIVFLYLGYLNQLGNNPIPLMPFLVLTMLFVAICLLFFKLTVAIDGSTVRVIYGIGLINIRFRIDKLIRVEIIKTPWYYGLGIRMTPKGMLYNIQGSKAIKLEYISSGKRKSVMIGTPEPKKLKEVLENNLDR